MTPEEFSETNVSNSISLYIATQLLAQGYIIYWQELDTVQVAPTGAAWYPSWSSNYVAYLADPTFSALFSAAKGMITLVSYLPAEPRFIERPITVAGPLAQNEVVIPALSIEIGPAVEIANYELGSRVKIWNRHLLIDGYVRTRPELIVFKDFLPVWFKNENVFDIADHDTGSLATVGQVWAMDTVVTHFSYPQDTPTTFEVLCNSRLEYVA